MKNRIICGSCGVEFAAFLCESTRKYCSRTCYETHRQIHADLTLTGDLAYLVGVKFGDGHASKQSFIVQITSREFADSCSRSLSAIGLKPSIKPVQPKIGRPMWRVVASSKTFAAWLRSLTIHEVRCLFNDAEHRKEFLRGVYESEGSAIPKKGGGAALTITSTTIETLRLFQDWAEERGHRFVLRFQRFTPTTHKPAYNLKMTTRHLIEAFLDDLHPATKLLPPMRPERFKIVEYEGQNYRIPELAKRFGLKRSTLYMRLFSCGWDIERSLKTPIG